MRNSYSIYVRLIFVLSLILLFGTQNHPAQATGTRMSEVHCTGNNGDSCGEILFSDDFSDGNADGWTPQFYGTWYVDNYQYVVEVSGGTDLRAISLAGNTTWTDYVFEVDLKADEGASKIILFRYIDEDYYYSIGLIGLEAYNYYKVNLVKVDNGVGTTVLNNDYPHDNSAWHHVKTVVLGNHITAYVDGDLVIDYIDSTSPVTHGRIGLQGFTGSVAENNKVRFDNVSVRSLCAVFLPMIIR